MYPYILKDSFVSIMIDNKSHTVNSTHDNFEAIREAIKEERWEDIIELIDVPTVINKFSDGVVTVTDGYVTYKGERLHNSLATRILTMRKEGFNIEPLVNFLEQLMMNPSKRAVDELYGFLEAGNMPITEDGHFLAYKKVRMNFTDQHSGKFDNSPGQIVEMPRNQVDEDKNRTCSAGLHFCSESYLGSFPGERVIILKINPADVVSIPTDYNNAKGRCCKYEVIGEYQKTKGGWSGDTIDKPAFNSSVEDDSKFETHREGIDTSKKSKSPRRDAAFAIINGIIDTAEDAVENTANFIADAIEDEEIRKDAVDKLVEQMDITRKNAGEYWRQFKTFVKNSK